jgi:hypothetical protein
VVKLSGSVIYLQSNKYFKKTSMLPEAGLIHDQNIL